MARYAVIGNPVAHSLSPTIHTLFANQTGEPVHYGKLLAPMEAFRDTVEQFRASGGSGLNVTLPFKGQARELSATLTNRARRAGAVNTLVFDRDGIRGDNTDGAGFVRDLRDNRQLALADARILILGAGGAVAGVLGPLLDTRPVGILIANRTEARAHELAAAFEDGGPVHACSLEDIPDEPVDLIVNAISAGLSGRVIAPPPKTVGAATACYDMVYSREATPFIRWAREHGARFAADGLGMLVEQAAESFYVWRGVRPETQPVLERLSDGG